MCGSRRWLVVTQEPPLPSIDLLARHEEKLAGVRFDPSLLAPSRLDYATSLAVQRISTGERQDVELPDNSEGIRYVRFHPARPYFVFASKVRDEPRFELCACELGADGKWSVRKLSLGEEERDGKRRTMNFVFGCAYQFVGDTSDDLLVKVVPEAWPERPPQEPVSTGPAIQEVTRGARKAPGRTYQGEWRGKKGGDAMFEFVLKRGSRRLHSFHPIFSVTLLPPTPPKIHTRPA